MRANGTLYAAGSHLTGWASNAAQFVTTTSKTLFNAQWVDNYNPSGSDTTYDSQSTFIFPYKHKDGHVTYIWMVSMSICSASVSPACVGPATRHLNLNHFPPLPLPPRRIAGTKTGLVVSTI